jgi:type VI protein secretion system component VasF
MGNDESNRIVLEPGKEVKETGVTSVISGVHKRKDQADKALKTQGTSVAQGLREKERLEGLPVIVIILAAAVLALFVLSLMSSILTNHRRRM